MRVGIRAGAASLPGAAGCGWPGKHVAEQVKDR